MTTYIRDLFDLPDKVLRGDFVLRLTEGVIRPKETIENYVVTPQLVTAFDEALSLIRAGLQSHSSKAAYLHGSFGSGKSHFMAVLNLILRNNADARSILELAPVIARHNEWTEGKKFLLVPYHMIGAIDMESAILGGYADHIKRIHPEVGTPGVYRADQLFGDAERLRQTMGDEAFFAELNKKQNGTGAAQSGWGNIGEGWDATSFDLALDAAPKAEDRVRLVGDLLETFFSAAKGAGEFVDLDTGLSIISRHAKSLGYDALILFLDELILWLASHSADQSFISREGQKLAKLVEAQSADRPVPIISFVARQRDLKELVGDQVMGAELISFTDTLRWWEARFSKITLEDRNLPAIAQKRVLKPRSEAARQMLRDAFETTASIREEVMNVLLTSQANREMFGKVYPFSPALIETLVAVSFVLQRERTALKVMLQLLVEQKDQLKLGEIIPVGDLFDVIAEGDEAFSDVMKVHFDNAKKLYEQKLKPILERDHSLSFEELKKLAPDDPKGLALRNDDRLIKTLLLSALAPNVESLRNLTAGKLAALNHGTIKSPIVGRETSVVLSKCRKWAAEVGQIKIGEEAGANQTISLQLTGVDTESILQQAETENNFGNRVRKMKELVLGQLGVQQEDILYLHHEFAWRATKRSCEIVFGNIREMGDASFENQGEDWRLIIDFPFDQENHSPRDDIGRLETYAIAHPGSARVIAWIPSFFSRQAQKELGTLVILDYLLNEERFPRYVTHLSPVDRNAAKSLLENQRSQLRQRMITYLEGVYGIAKPIAGSVDAAYELSATEHFQTLDQGFVLQPPIGASLKEAFEHLLAQTLKYQFPAHPEFEPEAKLNLPALRRTHETIERAAQIPDGRIAIESSARRELRQVANPLKIGEMHETHFLLGNYWKTHFLKKEAEHGGPMTVGKMRAWMDEPTAMGLPKELQNLVILSFATQTSRSFFRHGIPAPATIDQLLDDYELREQTLPTQEDWNVATKRAAQIFGITSSSLINAANVAKFVAEVKTAAKEHENNCTQLLSILGRLAPKLADTGLDFARYKTALAVKNLIDAVLQADEADLAGAVARIDIPSSETAMGSSLRKAVDVSKVLDGFNWALVEAIEPLADHRQEAAKGIWQSLKNSFQKDEYAIALGPALREIETKATKLLADQARPQSVRKQGQEEPEAGGVTPISIPVSAQSLLAHDRRRGLGADDLEALLAEIRQKFQAHPTARLNVTWELYEE